MRWRRSVGTNVTLLLSLAMSIAGSGCGSTSRWRSSGPEYTRWFERRRSIDPRFEWRAPIDFWGRIVDENSNAVPGVEIAFSWNDTSRHGTSQAKSVSDAQGRFSLLGRRGKGLSVSISKEGYYNDPVTPRRDFEYASPYNLDNRFIPDEKNPVIFRVRRMGKFADLHAHEKRLDLPNSGGEVVLDWERDKLASNGYFHVQIEVGPEEKPHQFDWRFRMWIPGGGFIPIDERELPLEAPAQGYREEIIIERKVDDPQRRAKWPTAYYVPYGEPRRYGRITLQLTPLRTITHRTSLLYLDYWINPSGSRNLEGDPKKGVPAYSRFADPL